MCEGRSVKIMEGEDCFRRGLSYGFKLPCRQKRHLSEKEQFPIRFLSGENCFGAVALAYVWVYFNYSETRCKK